jgi:CheY-like chemotaxis protein
MADGKKRILIADDETILLDMMVEFCDDIGVQAIPAENGTQALEKAVGEKPDAILVDNRMPDMLGLVVIEKLKASENTKNIPIVLLSGDAKLIETEAKNKGAFGVLLKPVTRATLKQMLVSCIGSF